MDLHSLLTNLSDKGVKLSINGGLLDVDAPKGVLTPELRNSLVEHKAELLLLLQENNMSASSTSLPAIVPAWSLFRLFDEWFQLYQNPDVALPPLEISFRDYVIAEQALQNTELYKRSQDYWLNRLESLPPAPDLPLAKTPKELKQHRCQRYDGRLNQTDWQQLKQRAARAGLTPSGVLLAAFAEILTVWSKIPQFTINLALFNRLPLHPQVNDILGDFTSVTLLAVDNSSSESFADRAVRIQKQLWQDLEHRYFSGVRVVRELARRKGTAPSAMPVVFTSTLGFGSLGQETLTFSRFGELVYGISQASQTWMDVQVWEEKGELTFNWDAIAELFPEGLIDDMFEAYCCFLQQLATYESVWVETTRQLVPPAQIAQRNAINTTDASIPNKLLQVLFAEQVQHRRLKPAVISSNRTLTYQELYELSNQVGHRLRYLGARPNQLVAIVMEKGWEQIVAVLGILNCGAAYLPIDPTLPKERLWYLLENGEVQLVLTQSWLNQKLEWPKGIKRICADTKELANESKQPLKPVQQLEDLAYVLYTSGSTGLPKGVAIAHRGVVNAITCTNQFFDIGSDDRVLALTALHHDMSVYDIFGILAAGGCLILPNAAATRNPAHWCELMLRENVTIWNSVPAMMEMLLEYAGDRSQVLPSGLRWAFLGGDWIPVTRLCVDTKEPASTCDRVEWVQQADDLAYVIYTSGSTGKPKGVAIAHRAAVNTILDINQRFDVKSQDRVFALSSLSFDLSLKPLPITRFAKSGDS